MRLASIQKDGMRYGKRARSDYYRMDFSCYCGCSAHLRIVGGILLERKSDD